MRHDPHRAMLHRFEGGGVRALSLWLWMGCAVGCVADEPVDTGPDTDPEGGACGAVTEHDLVVTGVVHLDGEPVEGANVVLEERAWHAGGKVFGTALSDAQGRFELSVDDVVSVEDCWGTALAYYLVGVRGDSRGELGVNGPLFHAIHNQESSTQVLFPVEIE